MTAKPGKTYAGALAETAKITLTDPDYWVIVKTKLSRGEKREAEGAMQQVVAESRQLEDREGEAMTATIRPDMTRYRDAVVRASIVEWNLTALDGTVAPLDIDLLDDDDFDLVYRAVNTSNRRKTPDEQRRFPDRG